MTYKDTRDCRDRVTIEPGVPFSPFYYQEYMKQWGKNRTPAKPHWPLDKMNVMDSFPVPITRCDTKGKIANFRMYLNTWGYRNNKKFIVLRDSDHKWRCWRIE